ncbi:MAG: hypothetical protein JNM07_11930 [Phycisphaerae bacterium]|nr:hypothetical protein [Phycisphaerae bacterium]
MAKHARRIRRSILAMACMSSILLALLLVWRFITFESVAELRTAELVGLLGLLLLPGATLAALLFDRKARADSPIVLAATVRA